MLLHYVKRGAYISFFYILSSVITRMFNFLMLPYFLTHLHFNDFGIWDFYQIFFTLGTLILTLCATTSLFRFYVLFKDDKEKQENVVSNSLLLVLCSVVGLLMSYGVFCSLTHRTLFDYAGMTIISIACSALYTACVSYLRVRENLLSYLIIFCCQSFLALGGTLIGLQYGLGVNSFFYAYLFSYSIFVPWFFLLFFIHTQYSFDVFKAQFLFSAPLLIFNLLYMSFFVIDKLFIKNFIGYETLGLYSILWRFGGIFQMIAIALIDTWQLIIYNAHKEEKSDSLIARLIYYYALTLSTFYYYTVLGSLGALIVFFPAHAMFMSRYLPLFFLPLFCIEIARLFQSAFGLSTKTVYLPCITGIVVLLQIILSSVCWYWGLWGIFFANTVTYSMYGIICFKISKRLYPSHLFSLNKMNKIFIFMIGFIGLLQWYILGNSLEVWQLVVVSSLWPLYVWTFIMELEEKTKFVSCMRLWYCQFSSRMAKMYRTLQ